jgi:erythromycin esterase
MRLIDRSSQPVPHDTAELVEDVRALSLSLKGDRDLDPLMERIGDARCVLLGEASHGTSEYYTWRTRISRRLIQEKGFSFIAVEGDWPDCYRVNRYVKGAPDTEASAYDVLHAYDRWPTWMWANEEVVQLVEWLRSHNDSLVDEAKVGFYGLDVYSLWDSMHAVIQYLERTDPDAVRAAWQALRCFEPYAEDAQEYAWATRLVAASCEDEVVATLRELQRQTPPFREEGREAHFNAEQNALVARNAERYYRTMVRGGSDSWNIRDQHMVETLERLMQHHGPRSKAIVWEHNTHIGDARATDMARTGMLNVGQLVRERRAREGVVLVGFGSHRGSVIAATQWGAPMERMAVPPAREESWEDICHRAGAANQLLILSRDSVPPRMLETRGHRAIGVVYDPAYEAFGNYVPTVLPRRYDAFLYLDETKALHPLHLAPREEHEPPETFPSGV